MKAQTCRYSRCGFFSTNLLTMMSSIMRRRSGLIGFRSSGCSRSCPLCHPISIRHLIVATNSDPLAARSRVAGPFVDLSPPCFTRGQVCPPSQRFMRKKSKSKQQRSSRFLIAPGTNPFSKVRHQCSRLSLGTDMRRRDRIDLESDPGVRGLGVAAVVPNPS